MICPGCGNAGRQEILRVHYEQIWRSLEEDLGVTFAESVRQAHTPNESTVLSECLRCRLQFFESAIPGTAEFYEALSRSPLVPYYRDRWEFALVARKLGHYEHVLDLGTGSGWFLDLALRKGCKTSAVETNPAAIASLAERGIDVYASIEAFIDSQRGPIDAVTAFQFVEHVANVGNLFELAKATLRPGGSLFVSVPNRARSGKAAFEPLDVPPHHLTRWSADVLRTLAQVHDLRLEAIMHEPPDVSSARQGARKGLYRRLKPLVPEQVAFVLARVAGRVVSRDPTYTLLTRTDGFRHFGIYGHSILAHYRTVWLEGAALRTQ